MLEKLPAGVGHALRGVRAGYEKVVSEAADFADAPETISLLSPAFEDGTSIPSRFTTDGEAISPPLTWNGAPGGAVGMVLIVEDPDAPTPEPLVHLLAWDLPPDLRTLPEGQFRSPGHDGLDEVLGRNSYLQAAWLPPDPPRGHGPHLYVFQLFALDRALSFERPPRRTAVVAAMKGHVLAKGVLVGTYARD
ncbi:YbhB/YbcL family Raf kinase inhibitor-like protein [Phenylobacterium sp.]|uniref:YbhB/YbcL family Raf kinase inhibitor-like protein n=1 Tax=Phenylobacterium sp. TaxID=1871053 RepID=UPI0025D493C5|nr:YbhB/YbcL family Raf kinase inhibitor-like protein [Phenylobacterium sp.]